MQDSLQFNARGGKYNYTGASGDVIPPPPSDVLLVTDDGTFVVTDDGSFIKVV